MKSWQMKRISRLQQLRATGALTPADFETQKQAILDARSISLPLIAGLGAVHTVGALAAIVSLSWQKPASAPLPAATVVPMAQPSPLPTIAVDTRSAAERLADAFEAATGHRTKFTQSVGGEDFSVTPVKILALPFGPVLVTRRELEGGCHACMGYLGIYYLKEDAAQTIVTGSYPKAVEGWGWGAAPTEWQLTTRFTTNPAIFASGGYMGQGIVMSSSTLTELRPDGPVTSDVIGTGYSDSGNIADDNPRKPCEVEGKIANIVPDRSFDVLISGSVSARDRYVKKGNRFVAAKKVDWGLPCADD